MRKSTPSTTNRNGAGRPKGSKNKKDLERVQQAAALGMLPHEFLAAVARGDTFDGYQPTFDERIRCAESAAKFYAAAKKEISGPGGGPVAVVDYSKMSAAQLEALEPVLAALLKGGG